MITYLVNNKVKENFMEEINGMDNKKIKINIHNTVIITEIKTEMNM
jgi:hypothetical protein